MNKRKKKSERFFTRCRRAKLIGTTRYQFDIPLNIVYNGLRVRARMMSDPETEFYFIEYYTKTGAKEEIHFIEHSVTFGLGEEITWIRTNLHQQFVDWLSSMLNEISTQERKVIIYEYDDNETASEHQSP